MKRKMEKVAFVGGLLVDGTGVAAVADSLVLVDDGTIVYAGKRTAVTEGYEIRDISGKTIMPGLIDAHLHLCGNRSRSDAEWVREDNYENCICAVQQAQECLEAGCTTIGDVSRFGIAIRNMVNAGEVKGPRIVTSGLGLCATAGHGDAHLCSVEETQAGHPWAELVDGPWDLRKAVRRRIRENPDAIKIWATGGGLWRWSKATDHHYTEEEIKAVVEEAHMRHMPVWSHNYWDAGPAVAAGCDVIVHCQGLSEKILDEMAEKGIACCPNVNLIPFWMQIDPPIYVPGVHDQYEGETLIDKEQNRLWTILRRANEKGIVLSIGSDCCFKNEMLPFGLTAINEIHKFVDWIGFSAGDAIVAATSGGAKLLRVDDVTGTIEAGKSADILVINGNPLEDIHAISVDNMEVIMKEGELIKG